jgi:hypothetical protein
MVEKAHGAWLWEEEQEGKGMRKGIPGEDHCGFARTEQGLGKNYHENNENHHYYHSQHCRFQLKGRELRVPLRLFQKSEPNQKEHLRYELREVIAALTAAAVIYQRYCTELYGISQWQ